MDINRGEERLVLADRRIPQLAYLWVGNAMVASWDQGTGRISTPCTCYPGGTQPPVSPHWNHYPYRFNPAS